MEVVVDGRGLRVYDSSPWKSPDPELLSTPGRYTVRLEGKVQGTGGPVGFATPDVPFEVQPVSPTWRPLSELEAGLDAAVGKARGEAVRTSGRNRSIVDDVGGGRWLRLWLDADARYDVTIVDTLMSPAGSVIAIQEFSHFTCVARGTAIATPRGDVAVESLAPGDVVWAWDVERGVRRETTVTALHESARGRLVKLGDASLTAEHPVWADDRWVPAADVAPGARLVTLSGAETARPTVLEGHAAVFDLSVGPPHTFFAGGVLVHNKAVPTELAPGDPWNGLFLRATDP